MEEKRQIKLTGQQMLQAYNTEQIKLEALQNRRQQLQGLIAETIGAEESLKGIEKAPKNQKIMVSLGAGIYIEAKIESGKEVKTGLGGGVLLNSSIEKALKALAKRSEEIQKDFNAVQQDELLVLQNLNNLGLAIENVRRKSTEKANEESAKE